MTVNLTPQPIPRLSFYRREIFEQFGQNIDWFMWRCNTPDETFVWNTDAKEIELLWNPEKILEIRRNRTDIECFAEREKASILRHVREADPEASPKEAQATFIMDIVSGFREEWPAWNRRCEEFLPGYDADCAFALAAMHLWNTGNRTQSTRTIEEDVRDETRHIRNNRLTYLHSLLTDDDRTWIANGEGTPTLEHKEQLRAIAAFIRFVEITEPKKIDQLAEEAKVESFPRH